MNRLNILVARYVRKDRQRRMSAWVARCFGVDRAVSLQERAARTLEEAIELVQACGLPQAKAVTILHEVYLNPPGEIAQEIGGLTTTVLSLAEALNLSADECEQRELERVEALPADHFRQRQARKAAVGVLADIGEAA